MVVLPLGSRWAVGWILMGLVGIVVLVNLYSYGDRRQLKINPVADRPSVSQMLTTDPTLLMIQTRPKLHYVKKNKTSIERVRLSSKSTEVNNSNSTDESTSPLFYMYDLEEEFWWRWPVDGADCSGNGYLGHEHKELSGIGPLLRPDDGLFLTWHFSLFSSLFNRMKRSSRRTLDPEKASLFIIPYDLGLDGYLNPHTCTVRGKCSDGLVGKLTTMLKASKYFQRYEGADHALLWSLGQYHPWPRAGCDVFMKDTCAKCTITCYWMDASKADSRFVSVPFPAAYHWWDGIKNLPWDLSLAPQRNLTAVYLGSTQTLNPTHTKIRRAMTAQCNVSTECHWLKIEHSSKDTSIADFLSVYTKAKFCLCPPGDDPARKAVFDSIVSGCIPVIFELNTIYNQYPWHLTEQVALDISVYIPGGAVRSGKLDFMSVLLAISPEVIRKKQEAIAAVAPRVQYAMPPPELLKDRYDNTTWDPPFKDGVELTLDGMFARADAVVNNRSTHIPPKVLSGREWGREYDMVRVQVPNITADHLALQQEQDRLIRQGRKAGPARLHHSTVRSGHGGHGVGRGIGHGVGVVGGGIGSHLNLKISGGGGVVADLSDTVPIGGVGGGVGGLGKTGLGKHGVGHGGHGIHAGHKLRSLPSMGAPGEAENANSPP